VDDGGVLPVKNVYLLPFYEPSEADLNLGKTKKLI
jgi:hypothetical protein